MSFNYFSGGFLDIKSLIPVIANFPNYEVFNEIDRSWNVAIQKYGHYMHPFTDIERHKLFYHLMKKACNNKKMIIKNPFEKEIICSDIYFITHLTCDNDNDFVFNYYFEKKKLVLGILSGSGQTGLAITFAYIVNINENKIFFFHGINFDIVQHTNYFLPKILQVVSKIDIEKINSEPSLIRTLEGYNHGLFHTCCTFVNGIYIMDQIGIKNDIDEIIMGPNDPFLIEKYYKNKYPNINVVKGIAQNEFDIHKIYKGVIFKYGHFHLTNKCAQFIKSYITNVLPIGEENLNEIEYIKNNFYPIFSFNLRCVTCEIKDQDVVISNTINKLKSIFPNSFFLIGGFLGDYNEELLSKQNVEIGVKISSYIVALNEYENTFNLIKSKVNHQDMKSLINLKINNVLEYTKIVTFSIHNNCGYQIIEAVLHNIPGLYFGTKWVDHVKKSCYVSKENYKEPIYIDGLSYISDDIYDSVTCEISDDKIINTILDYAKNNPELFKEKIFRSRSTCVVCEKNTFKKSFNIINTINVVEDENISHNENEIKHLYFVECLNCSCIQLKNLFNPEEIYNQPSHYLEGELWQTHNILFSKFVSDNIIECKSIIEIGGGSGNLARNIIKDISKIEKYRILEISIEHIYPFEGVEYISGNCETFDFNSLNVNSIILSHVFEHLYEPKKFIDNIKNTNINEIFISIPDMESLYKSNDINVLNIQHTFYIDTNFIVKMFSDCNFIIKNIYNYKKDSNFYHFIKDNNTINTKIKLFNDNSFKNKLNLEDFYNNLKNKIKTIDINKPFFICPSGVYGKMVYYYLNENTQKNIIGFLDSDSRKINKRLSGTNCKIFNKTHIKSFEQVTILIISERYKVEIICELKNYNDNIEYIFL
jgi:2-polyprenyl-3-methyl-5-hydroxy-6-metoxy-1,4-benzoquinol methylase